MTYTLLEASCSRFVVYICLLHPSSRDLLPSKVLSGKEPYHDIHRETDVLSAMSKGQRPERPTDSSPYVSDAQWKLIQRCWQDDPLARPDIGEVKKQVTAMWEDSLRVPERPVAGKST